MKIPNQNLKMIEEIQDQEKPSKEELKERLLIAKSQIEEELKKIDKHDTHTKVIETLEKTRIITDSVTRMQDELNRVWKGLEQVHEDLLHIKNQTE